MTIDRRMLAGRYKTADKIRIETGTDQLPQRRVPATGQHTFVIQPLIGLQTDSDYRYARLHRTLQQYFTEIRPAVKSQRRKFTGRITARQFRTLQHDRRIDANKI